MAPRLGGTDVLGVSRATHSHFALRLFLASGAVGAWALCAARTAVAFAG
jgi:hypothetical protein